MKCGACGKELHVDTYYCHVQMRLPGSRKVHTSFKLYNDCYNKQRTLTGV